MTMMNIVGVQFRRAGKIYDFAAGDISLRVGDPVVVETERGPSIAKVAKLKFSEPRTPDQPLKKVIRRAHAKDLDTQGKLTEERVLHLTQEKVRNLNLDMRVLKSDVQFSGNKAIIYFSAPGRVDFRDLVKELASGLKARVELKQVGARDEAKLIGGMGICGREFCCSSFLREFVPVSIKMAKNQNLALNPTKISGGCGRLLCCLTYEDETYSALRKLMPSRGVRVRLDNGEFGDVLKSDFINQLLLVELEDGSQNSFPASKVTVVAKRAGVTGDDWADDIDLEALGEMASEARPETNRPKRRDERRGGRDAGARRDQQKPSSPPRNQQASKPSTEQQVSTGEPGDAKKKRRNRRRGKKRGNPQDS